MRDGEKRNRTGTDLLEIHISAQDDIEQEVTAFVSGESDRGAGEEFS